MYHFNNVITKSILIILVKLARFLREKKKNLETQKVHASASSQNKLKEPNNEQC